MHSAKWKTNSALFKHFAFLDNNLKYVIYEDFFKNYCPT